jgi:hypothetical protein
VKHRLGPGNLVDSGAVRTGVGHDAEYAKPSQGRKPYSGLSYSKQPATRGCLGYYGFRHSV